jgi:hydroxymethylglutaryl-CoA lyase
LREMFRPRINTLSTFRRYSTQRSSNFIRIVDVSPRDGLQNEKSVVSTEIKLELVDRLTRAGLSEIEVTSFVSPKWVPQMGDAKTLYPQVLAKYSGNGVKYPVLTPNIKGLEGAIESAATVGQKVQEVAIFGAASEGFSQKNTNRSIEQGFQAFQEVVSRALENDIPVRAYLSTVIGCPYDGPTKPETVARLTERFLELGCYEVSLGDTIGVGTPSSIELMLKEVLKSVPAHRLAIHAHDTYGQGVANVVKAVEMGLRSADSSVGGLGGCPYAKGASGNVSTEDVVYALHGLGMETGIDLEQLSRTGAWISEVIGRPNGSKAGTAIVAKL